MEGDVMSRLQEGKDREPLRQDMHDLCRTMQIYAYYARHLNEIGSCVLAYRSRGCAFLSGTDRIHSERCLVSLNHRSAQ
jgi:hypothetical protein